MGGGGVIFYRGEFFSQGSPVSLPARPSSQNTPAAATLAEDVCARELLPGPIALPTIKNNGKVLPLKPGRMDVSFTARFHRRVAQIWRNRWRVFPS